MTDAEIARLEERIIALRERAEVLDAKLDTIRTDHVQRQEFTSLSDRVAESGNRITYLYGGLFVVGLIGIANLIRAFGG